MRSLVYWGGCVFIGWWQLPFWKIVLAFALWSLIYFLSEQLTEGETK